MKYPLTIAAAVALPLAASSAQAAPRTVVLTVHHADCALCGPLVKATLERVKGVETVSVSQADAMADVRAKVTFDDARTGIPKLITATTEAGYPSEVAPPARK